MACFLFFTSRQVPKMTDETIPSVKLFSKENFNVDVTQLVINIYPSPEGGYFGYWHMNMPHADEDDEVNIEELYALKDATKAAYSQIRELLRMIEEQDDY